MSFYDYKGGTPEGWGWFECAICEKTFREECLAEEAPEHLGNLCLECWAIEEAERGVARAEAIMEDR